MDVIFAADELNAKDDRIMKRNKNEYFRLARIPYFLDIFFLFFVFHIPTTWKAVKCGEWNGDNETAIKIIKLTIIATLTNGSCS